MTGLNIIFAFAIVLLLATLAVLWTKYKHRQGILKQMKESNDSLERENATKSDYIRQLTALCGQYIESLDDFNRLVNRKVKVGQTQDLVTLTQSRKIIKDRLTQFTEVFDASFLKMFPRFVDRVNELMNTSSRFTLGSDRHLGTELRIMAFIRLGIDDAQQVARMLGLSVNTVYTYRNKIKSGSRDKANFDNAIRNIQ